MLEGFPVEVSLRRCWKNEEWEESSGSGGEGGAGWRSRGCPSGGGIWTLRAWRWSQLTMTAA